MKRLALLIILVGFSVSVAHADDIDIQLHGTADTTISLSGILNQWGSPGTSSNTFTIPGSGTDLINGLNLTNDTGVTINSIQLYAFGTIGTGSSFSPACGNPSPAFFSSCTAPGTQAAGPLSSPIEWTFSSGSITNGTAFRIVDQNTEPAGTALYYEIEINGNSPTAPPGTSVPEPSSILLLGAGLLSLGLLGAFKHKLPMAA